MSFGFLQTLPTQPVDHFEEEETDASACKSELATEPQAEPEPLQEAAELTDYCRQLLLNLGMQDVCSAVHVQWNSRLRSTAGYASYPSWRIELNPRLAAFAGQVDRTLKHELAHLIAYHRAGHRRIEPHGVEWRRACADLGIPNEHVRHSLPLPRTKQTRRLTYQCAHCGLLVERVKPFLRETACLDCCRKYNRGRYDARFRFLRVMSQSS
jgi:predicted SprT family Zn-dependent metalloprotease